MTAYAALLRAVNVGGTGKLAMADLRALCTKLGFDDPTTYIQSGNVVFGSKKSAASVKSALEAALEAHMGKPVRVLVRTKKELSSILAKNPYPEAEPARLLIFFFDEAPPTLAADQREGPDGEELRLKGRELFVHFPNGMGKSKLKIPHRDIGTGRNLNTVRKLAQLLEART